jgi:hypothetical protein
MKRILTLVFLVFSFISWGQDTTKYINQDQQIKYQNKQWFVDSIIVTGLYGNGTIVKIDENGYLYKDFGTQDTLVDTSQVVNLNKYLNLKQDIISVDSNFVFTGNKIDLNDTIWTEVGIFSKRSVIKNTVPLIELNETDGSLNNKRWRLITDDERFRIRALSDAGDNSGDFVDFTRSESSITSFRMLSSGTPSITLKNSGTGVFEDTVRTGQLKASGLLYPLSDGINKQVIKTDGSGNLTFSGVGALLTAGSGITISNDTISSTATGSDGDWTINGNYVYNLSDSIGIGVSNPSMALDVAGRVNITNINTGLTVTNTGASSALNLVSNVAGSALTINSGVIDSLSNDATLSGNDANDIVSEQAIKGYVDDRILNDTRVSWGADVDTSARVDGFVLKWNNGTKKHYYDTAGTGGGGGSYFAGAGLELSASKFSIGADSINRTMIGDTMVSYAKIQNLTANTVLARGEATDGVVQEIPLAAERLLGRGQSGNITAISLNGLSMSGNTLTNTNTGTVTNVISGNGLNFTDFTTSGTITLGAPTAVTSVSTNSVGANSHTHAFTPAGSSGEIQFNSSSSLGADADLFWNSASNRLGIGTSSPSSKLDVNGKITTDSLLINNYRLPLADGTNGQVMTTNGSGVVSFSSPTTGTGTVTNIASGNGMSFSSITTTGTVTLGTPQTTSISTTNQVLTNSHTHQLDLSGRTLTAGDGLTGGGTLGANRTFTLGTPQTLTGTTTNAVTTNSHTHALDFSTFPNNIRTFYFDTARVIGDDLLIGGKMPITNQEKVIAFTMSRYADSLRLPSGYYTLEGMVDIEITNDDTTAGISGFFQNYQLNVFVTESVQALARNISGTTTVLETAEANATPQSITNADGNPKDGTIRLHLVTTPIKFYLDGTQFVALTIKANYPSPADFVSHKRAVMRITRAIDFDGEKEQTPDIATP